jgi:hypothetical protein
MYEKENSDEVKSIGDEHFALFTMKKFLWKEVTE